MTFDIHPMDKTRSPMDKTRSPMDKTRSLRIKRASTRDAPMEVSVLVGATLVVAQFAGMATTIAD